MYHFTQTKRAISGLPTALPQFGLTGWNLATGTSDTPMAAPASPDKNYDRKPEIHAEDCALLNRRGQGGVDKPVTPLTILECCSPWNYSSDNLETVLFDNA
jgi:hypothetical protein